MMIYLTSYITNTKINIHMIDITYKTGTYASAMFGSNVSPSVVYSDHTIIYPPKVKIVRILKLEGEVKHLFYLSLSNHYIIQEIMSSV